LPWPGGFDIERLKNVHAYHGGINNYESKRMPRCWTLNELFQQQSFTFLHCIMSPSTVVDNNEAQADSAGVAALHAKAASKRAEITGTVEHLPVSDDYMYDFKFNHPLPTTDVLGVQIPEDCNAQAEAQGIVERLSEALGTGNAEAFADMFLEYGTICPTNPPFGLPAF
jgi:hypothetical protein